MNYLAVRMGAEEFHGKAKHKMLGYLQKHIPFGFVVAPVIDDKVWDKAYKEVDLIDNSGCCKVTLVVVFYRRKRHVPDPPNDAEDKAGSKEIKAAANAVYAVGVPAEFFDNWGDD